jgi:hypothetical protein
MRNSIKGTVLFISVSLLLSRAYGQGSFENLGFEMTPIDLGPAGVGAPTDYYSIPYWSATCGPYQTGVTLSIWAALDATTVSLATGAAIDGTTSVTLSSSSYSYPSSPVAIISQTALVPSTAQSLNFKVDNISSFLVPASLPGQFFVTMNGENIALQVLTINGYTVLAGNISTWAGQTATLSIGVSVPPIGPDSPGEENLYIATIDDVAFSTTSVPEPATLVLALLAGSLFLWGRRICIRPLV